MMLQQQRCINSLARGNGSWAKDANCLSNRSRLQQRFVLKQFLRVIWFKIYYFTWAVVRFPNSEEGRGNLTRWWSAAEDRLVIKSTTSVPKFQFFCKWFSEFSLCQNVTKMKPKCDQNVTLKIFQIHQFRTSRPESLLVLVAGKTDYCLIMLQQGMLKVLLRRLHQPKDKTDNAPTLDVEASFPVFTTWGWRSPPEILLLNL